MFAIPYDDVRSEGEQDEAGIASPLLPAELLARG
jgi:hypothetical protein